MSSEQKDMNLVELIISKEEDRAVKVIQAILNSFYHLMIQFYDFLLTKIEKNSFQD